ncbi:MAG: alpha/beta hydrolase [Legionellaceae bacterium]|nr:alpha/beta hydrolase [Legionellaceae bacterium]
MSQAKLVLQLPDERNLGYAEYGDATGYPVFFFHGFPGSRLQPADFNIKAKEHHCRLIGIDRPGAGVSTIDKSRTILSFANDIVCLANHLKIDKFAIIGHSGGAPYVGACAYAIPERLTGAAIVSGIAPLDLPDAKLGMNMSSKIINTLAKNIPGAALFLMLLQRLVLNLPNKITEKMYKKMMTQLPLPDQKIMQDPIIMSSMIASIKEGFKQGVVGVAEDFKLIINPWGFDLKKITFPITIWQGKLDNQVPISHANIYKKLIPNSKVKLFEDEAHISTLYNHIEEILDSLI